MTTEKLLGKKNGTELGLKNQQKNDEIEFRKKKMTKWKSNLKSKNILNVSSYYGENWKVVTIYLIIVTVIIEVIVKMIAMLMNKDNKHLIRVKVPVLVS